ncbi:hypothetical protein MSAN_00958300 [Mycena sanguinolenta]|uniref:Uncharacterized protein n=1 Tax=Mycena sanguinolenta TaxID=230812 RepID=A0A8H6Z083_9AGAR|nr:hypothetical protein MSAN_00958300 [Mycena sanguinolenta]
MLAPGVASGSYAETLALFKWLPDADPTHLPFVLPAFHTALHPARISTILARFDSLGWPSIRSDIDQAHLCLRAIFLIGRSDFIQFDASVDLLSGDDFDDTTIRHMIFLELIRLLHNNKPVKPIIDSSPGVYVVVGRAWRHFLVEEPDDKDGGLFDVAYLLSIWASNNVRNSSVLEELITGSGGTQAQLASIVVSHIKRVLPDPDSPVSDQTMIHIIGLACIVSSTHPGFGDALLSAGIVVPLTTAVRALCRSTVGNVIIPLRTLFSSLVNHISSLHQ